LSKDKREKVGDLTNGQNDYHYTNTDLTNTFLVKGKTGYMGDIISMFDKRLYKSWDKLSYSLKANKPIAQEEGGDAESLFNQAKSSNQVEQIQKFTHGMYGISVGPAIALAKAFDFSKYKKDDGHWRRLWSVCNTSSKEILKNVCNSFGFKTSL
jgi:hypothetical protein